MPNQNKIYVNKAQAYYAFINAAIAYLIWARGTGKTAIPVAHRCIDNMLRMPRGITGFMGKSYESLLTKIIPGLIQSWEQMGFIEDLHFVVGKRPEQSRRWDKAYFSVKTYKHYISWFNGHGTMLFSLDRAFNNGPNLDGIIVDEARFFDKEKIDEVIKAIRGNRNRSWATESCYAGQLYTSDMPKTLDERWLLASANMATPKIVKQIDELMRETMFLDKLLKASVSDEEIKAINKELYVRNKELNNLRSKCIFTSRADTLDNIQNLGAEAIEKMLHTTSVREFRRGNLNIDTYSPDESFYITFSKRNQHANSNESYIDSLDLDFRNIEKDSRWDRDCNTLLPIDVGIDYGKRFNCITAWQPFNDEYRCINAMHVFDPKRCKHLVNDFCYYYRHHQNKKVRLYYDHTGKAGSTMDELTQVQDAVNHFTAHGWRVKLEFIGRASFHQERYKFYEKAFAGELPGVPHISLNMDNCEDLIISVESAPSKEKKGEIHKDKSSEDGPLELQHHATHYSESMDMVLFGRFSVLLKSRGRTGMGAFTA